MIILNLSFWIVRKLVLKNSLSMMDFFFKENKLYVLKDSLRESLLCEAHQRLSMDYFRTKGHLIFLFCLNISLHFIFMMMLRGYVLIALHVNQLSLRLCHVVFIVLCQYLVNLSFIYVVVDRFSKMAYLLYLVKPMMQTTYLICSLERWFDYILFLEALCQIHMLISLATFQKFY